MPVADTAIRDALARTLDRTDFGSLGSHYEGKVRDNYTTTDGRRFIVVTDRISAFDRVVGTLPLKGQILNQMAAWWFAKTAHVAKNHLIRVPDPNAIEAVECEPLPVEMVVRAYVTGVTSTSIWTHYAAGKREFCGNELPDGLKKNQKLDAPILTPSTKAEKGDHDVSVSRAEILAMGRLSAADFDFAADAALRLFDFGAKLCRDHGLILVDTKYEFGRAPNGDIVVIDEVHTPDSSRFWFATSYEERFAKGQEPESFDKEYVRRFLAERGFKGDGPIPVLPDDVRVEATRRYLEAYERITGESFVPNLDDPQARLRKNLGVA
jgi:phosphoribosylaminoimidazole-succinocarboxamide synthase